MRRHLFILFLVAFTLSCSKEKDDLPTPEPEQPLAEAKHLNVVYATGGRNKMDVFLPEGRNAETPMIVLIHGGTWIGGSKEDLSIVQQQLLVNKIASININYRYAALDHHYDGMMQDVAAALSTLKEKSGEWGVRDQGYSMLGVSAGGHLALLYAYGFQRDKEIKTVISVAGPSDLATLSTDPIENILLRQILVGAPIDGLFSHPRFLQANPIHHIQNAVPTLMIHGTADEVVPYQQSVKLQAALQAEGVTQKLVTLEGARHDIQINPADMLRVFSEVNSWIKAH